MSYGFVPALFGNIGIPELLLILVIVLVIFGAGKLPQLGDALGKGIRNFRNATKGDDKDKEKAAEGQKELGGAAAKGELPAGQTAAAPEQKAEARDVTGK
jgi:sec-independent protein translocase protein TatA